MNDEFGITIDDLAGDKKWVEERFGELIVQFMNRWKNKIVVDSIDWQFNQLIDGTVIVHFVNMKVRIK